MRAATCMHLLLGNTSTVRLHFLRTCIHLNLSFLGNAPKNFSKAWKQGNLKRWQSNTMSVRVPVFYDPRIKVMYKPSCCLLQKASSHEKDEVNVYTCYCKSLSYNQLQKEIAFCGSYSQNEAIKITMMTLGAHWIITLNTSTSIHTHVHAFLPLLASLGAVVTNMILEISIKSMNLCVRTRYRGLLGNYLAYSNITAGNASNHNSLELAKYEGHMSQTDEAISVALKLCFALFFNTVIVITVGKVQ